MCESPESTGPDSVVPGWGLKCCVSNKIPGDIGPAGLQTDCTCTFSQCRLMKKQSRQLFLFFCTELFIKVEFIHSEVHRIEFKFNEFW